MKVDITKNSKRKGISTDNEDRELLGESKKRKPSHSKQNTDLDLNLTKKLQFRLRRIETCMDIFVRANEGSETELVKLNTIEIKNLRDGFKYLGYRCRVAVSRQKIKDPKSNLPTAFNWVEGIIKFWDPKFRLFFVHFLLSPSINSFRNLSNIPKHEWKYLATQNNSPPAITEMSNLVISPYAIDRGWFDSNPITIRVYGNSPVIDMPSTLLESRLVQAKYKELTNGLCTSCKLPIIKDEIFLSCDLCSKKFHSVCVSDINSNLQDLNDSNVNTLRQYNFPSTSELLAKASEHNQYIRERKRLWKRNSNISQNIEGNLSLNNKFFHENQLPYDLVDVEELEKALPNEVKNIILKNYSLPHTSIRKLLSKLPSKIGCIIGDHQVKLLCRNYRYNKRNKSKLLTQSFKEEFSRKSTIFESPPSKPCLVDKLSSQESNLINEVNSNFELIKNESNPDPLFFEDRKMCHTDFANFENNNSIQIFAEAELSSEQMKMNECKYRCKDCLPCIYCNEPLLRIPLILKPNELPSRSVVYSQIPTKVEDFVICSTCGIFYHGSCGNSFVPPLIFGGNNFKCSNCCKCVHCGYRDDGFMDYASWNSNFSSCIRCCKGFEKGQFCSICRKIWTSSWEGEWLQCDVCKFWVHYDCDKELSEPMEYYSNLSNFYNCPACRSNDSTVKFQRILEYFICLDKNKDFASTPLPSYQSYWKVVKIPMDIMTITKNLESKKYESDSYSFIKDVYRILYNAQISHMPNHRIFKLAANILKKVTHLFKLLFGENTLLDFFKIINEEESSMSILLDQINTDNFTRIKKNEEALENTNSNTNIEISPKCKATKNFEFENIESELAVNLTESILKRLKVNLNINYNLRRTVSRKQIQNLNNFDNLNSLFGELMSEFNNCTICNKGGTLVNCLKCGLPSHSSCSEQVSDSFVCNSCTDCQICSDLLIETSIPVIQCCACTKRAHYTCIWQEYEKFMYQSSSSDAPLSTNKRSKGRNIFTNLAGTLKDNRNYICLWKIFSSASSPNKSTTLISSPFTAVYGKGYYQYLINELYLCTECFEAKVYLHSNLYMRKYANNYNAFLFNRVIELQRIIEKIIIKHCKGYFYKQIKGKEIFEILSIISKADLKQFNISCKQENVVICNLCSTHFYCKNFKDLIDIANDSAVCSISLNFICNNCNNLRNESLVNRFKIKNIEGTQNTVSISQENLKEVIIQAKAFPLILNTLISASQFRITLSKDFQLLLKIILNPFLNNSISGIAEKHTLNLSADKGRIESEVFTEYLNSESFTRLIRQTLQSSLLQWYLFYIHLNGSFDFSSLRRDYLQHFYRKNEINLNDLIQNNTILIIINSIEKMVLSNETNNTSEQNKIIQNSLNNQDYLSLLGLYSNLLLLPNNFHLFGMGNLNIMNYQAIIDTKMYLDIKSSFNEYLLNRHKQKLSISQNKQKALKNEILQGLAIIKNQLENEKGEDFKLPELSIFVLIYNFILNEFNEKNDSSDNNTSNCKYCGRAQNMLLGEQLIRFGNNVQIHKECVLWSLPFVLEPILNHLDMSYESKFEISKKKSDIYKQKYQTFEKISWPIIKRPILVDVNDIIITLNDFNVLKCFFCTKSGATIKCSGNDTCFKYYHIDCIFKNFQDTIFALDPNEIFTKAYGKVISNFDSKVNSLREPLVHIRLKYRRVWCNDCWKTYNTMVEPEPSFSEGLTGGILNTFASMLSVDINITKNTKFQEAKSANNKVKIFLGQLITFFSELKKKPSSKIKTLIHKLEIIRDSISCNDSEFETCIINNSIILLDPGLIIENENFLDEEKMFITPVNYKLIRIWKSSRVINNLFKIDNNLSLYLCSTFEVSGNIYFQIDWIPSSQFQLEKVKELSAKKKFKIEDLLCKIYINKVKYELYSFPLLRDSSLKNIFNSFSELLSSESLKDVSQRTLETTIYPSYLSEDYFSNHSNKNEMQFISNSNSQSQVFFGFREEFIHSLIKRKLDEFCILKIISAFYDNKILTGFIHPELWVSHRQHRYSKELSKFKGFDFNYSKLGRNEMTGSRVSEDLFNVLQSGNNQDPDNVELMNSIYQVFQESSRRNKIKLEGMAPSKLYRYLDSLPYDKRLSIKKSNIHGFGLFAKEPIKTGEPIIEYVGELVRNSIADKRENFYKSNGNRDGSCYMFRLDESSVIDATNIGNHARFMNHCCDPNSICKVISVDSQNKHIVIFSKKNINKDEEITYDYQFNVEEASEKIICYCGANNCLGRMN